MIHTQKPQKRLFFESPNLSHLVSIITPPGIGLETLAESSFVYNSSSFPIL